MLFVEIGRTLIFLADDHERLLRISRKILVDCHKNKELRRAVALKTWAKGAASS